MTHFADMGGKPCFVRSEKEMVNAAKWIGHGYIIKIRNNDQKIIMRIKLSDYPSFSSSLGPLKDNDF
jgi:hypothetical protein